MKEILAWHWCKADMKTQHSNEPIKLSHILRVNPPLILCSKGLHASIDPFDALQYAPGPIICRVKLSGVILKGDDKVVAETREVLWFANAETMLHEFACDCAERALHVSKVTDQRCHNAIKAKRRWLKKGITDKELAAARAAAWAAARAAAWDAAWAAARDAAWAAARAAARAAAWDAARAAENKWQREEFNRRIKGLAQ